MTKKLILSVSAVALVAGLSLSAAYANPTAKDNDHNSDSYIGNVENGVGVGIYQDATADGSAEASADYNGGSWASAWAGGLGGSAGTNTANVTVAVETGNVALVSDNELKAGVSNWGGVSADAGWCADASTGASSQNDAQQTFAAGMFNNDLSTGLGNGQQQGNTVGVNANTITF